MEERKRKCFFGNSETERKYYKENIHKSNPTNIKEESIIKEYDGYTVFLPRSASSAQKVRNNNITYEQPRNGPLKSRRKIPLSNVGKTNNQNTNKAVSLPVEADIKKLTTRQRQIDIGKNTEGYRKYLQDVARMDRTSDHPWTPNKFSVCSTRSWQGVMRIWRRKLHFWDPLEINASKETFCDGSVNTIESQLKSTKKHIDNSMDVDDIPSSGSSQASSSDEFQTKDSWYHSEIDQIHPRKNSDDWYNSEEDDLMYNLKSSEGEKHLFEELL